MKAACPTSLKVTFESITRGRTLSLDQCLIMEFRLTVRCARRSDLYSGIRSAVVTKDRNPSWEPSELSAVTQSEVGKFFEPLESDVGIPELDIPVHDRDNGTGESKASSKL